MRFLNSLLAVVSLLLVVISTLFYLSREFLLYRGVQNFKKSVLELQLSNQKAITACQSKSPDLLNVQGQEGMPTLQIRFTSSTEYVLEVICPQYSFDPVTLETKKLDTYVTKLPGSSGIILGPDRSGVELAVFYELENEVNQFLDTTFPFIQKTKPVVFENNGFIQISAQDLLGEGPITSCQGYGYQCCQADSSIGSGDKIDGLPGCETSCYSQCTKRPVVLSFTSNPYFDIKTRKISISAGESVDFSYLVDMGKSNTVEVEVDFGDGEKKILLERTGTVSHTYACATSACEYTAMVRAKDGLGISSADTTISKLVVEVGPR